MKIQLLDIKQGSTTKRLGGQGIDISGINRSLTITQGKLFLNEENDQILIRPQAQFRIANGEDEEIFVLESEYMVFFRLEGVDGQTPEQALGRNPALVAKLHEYSQIAVGIHLQMELNLTTLDAGMPLWEGEYIAPNPS